LSVSKTTWVAALVLLLTFGAGFVGGLAVHRAFVLRHHGMAPRTDMMLNHLDRALDLSDAQRKQIAGILSHRRERIESLWSGVRPRVRAEVEATNAEIERVLTAEQRAKFERMKMRMGRRGGPFAPMHERH
jgi:hypothetical protein